MLTHPPGSYKPISYEQMYSAVYKWVTLLFPPIGFSSFAPAHLIGQVCLQAVQWNSLQGPVQPHEVVGISEDKLNSWQKHILKDPAGNKLNSWIVIFDINYRYILSVTYIIVGPG